MDEEGKKQRREYKRRWQSADRKLKKIKGATERFPSSSDSDDDMLDAELLSVPQAATRQIAQNIIESSEVNQNGTGTIVSSTASVHTSDVIQLDDESWNWDLTDSHVAVSSDSEMEENLDSEPISLFSKELSQWINTFDIKHNAVDELLKLLGKDGHSELPCTAHTLMSTPRSVVTEKRSGMEFVYLGLQNQLLRTLRKYPPATRQSIQQLKLSFNIDGIPLFKSTNTSLWPVLCALSNIKPVKVFPVALCCGGLKPNNLEFFLKQLGI